MASAAPVFGTSGYRVWDRPGNLVPQLGTRHGSTVSYVDAGEAGGTFAKLRLVNPAISAPRRMMQRRLPVYVDKLAPPTPDVRDPLNVSEGAHKRILGEVPPLNRAELRRFRSFVRVFIRKHYTPLPASTDLSFETWLDNTKNYNEKRKEQLRKVYNLMEHNVPLKKRDRKVKTFIKSETYSEYKFPRLINAVCDRNKVVLGPAAHAMEQVVYANSARIPVKFIKHVPVCERPAYLEQLFGKSGTKVQATDYSSFECAFHRDLQAVCEQQLYSYLLRNFPRERAAFALMMGWNWCRSKTGVNFKVKGRRMSGEMVTSLGNGFTNAMLLMYTAHVQGVQLLAAVVEGDDGLYETVGKLDIRAVSNLGFKIKVEDWDRHSDAGFCGIKYDPIDLVPIVDPVKALTNLGWTRSVQMWGKERKAMGLLRAKAFSLAYGCPGCPVLWPLAKRLLEITKEHEASFELDAWHLHNLHGGVTPTDVEAVEPIAAKATQRTRDLFARLFGISVSKQLELEEAIEGVQVGPLPSLFTDVCHSEASADMWNRYAGLYTPGFG